MNLNPSKKIALVVLFAFMVNTFGPLPCAYADDFVLPAPGVMVHLSPEFNPPILKGIKVHPDNPFRFDFILDKGDSRLSNGALKDESSKLIKYFLASLTIPEKDLWVNLSPYEKDRIIPQSFGLTEMGRDLLAEDYMLKQITASLIYPEDSIGKKFWKRIYEESEKRFGTTNIPVNTFNKVWIVPEKAVVYENAHAGTAYVVESKLKVMLEQDYLSLQKHEGISSQVSQGKATNQLGSQIVREIVLPELAKEVNENKNFAHLRQVYNSLILAMWYKNKIKDSILEQVYADKNKVAGVNIDDPKEKQRIYERYLQAFKKGVYNYIKEDIDPSTQEAIPRKYFSGGLLLDVKIDYAQTISDPDRESNDVVVSSDCAMAKAGDRAMNVRNNDQGFGYAFRRQFEQNKRFWESHIQKSKAYILAGAQNLPPDRRRVVTILGPNEGREIPLTALAEEFETLYLVDIDEDSVIKARDSIPKPLRHKVHIVLKDVSGAVVEITKRSEQIINDPVFKFNPNGAEKAIWDMIAHFPLDTQNQDLLPYKADYVVSSIMVDQIPSFALINIAIAFENKFKVKFRQLTKGKDRTDVTNMIRNFIHQHAILLRNLTNPGGIIYWSSTVRESGHNIYLNRYQNARFTEGLIAMLKDYPWGNILNGEQIKQIEKIRPEVKGEAYKLLAGFSVENDLERNKLCVDLIMSAISGEVLPMELSEEIIRKRIEIGERLDMERYQINSIESDRLSDYFTPYLIPVDQGQEWLWTSYAEGVLKGEGGIFYVQAHLLRPKSDDLAMNALDLIRYYADGYHKNYQINKKFWEPHIIKSREYILAGARMIPADQRHVVTILGAGQASEIPLRELAETFERVNLVDIDIEGIKKALKSLPSKLRPKVHLIQEDVAAGGTVSIIEKSVHIINDNANIFSPLVAAQAVLDVISNETFTKQNQNLLKYKSDYVISSVMSDQISAVTFEYLNKLFEEKFKFSIGKILEKYGQYSSYKTVMVKIQERTMQQHARLLSLLCKPEGLIYWSSTFERTGYFNFSNFIPEVAAAAREGNTSHGSEEIKAELLHMLKSYPWASILNDRILNEIEQRNPNIKIHGARNVLANFISPQSDPIKELLFIAMIFEAIIREILPAGISQDILGKLVVISEEEARMRGKKRPNTMGNRQL